MRYDEHIDYADYADPELWTMEPATGLVIVAVIILVLLLVRGLRR